MRLTGEMSEKVGIMSFSIINAELYLVVLNGHYGRNLPKYVQCNLDDLMYGYLVTPAIWSRMPDISEEDVKSQMPEVFVYDTDKHEMVRVEVKITDLEHSGIGRSEDGYYGFNAVLTIPGTESTSYGYFAAKA